MNKFLREFFMSNTVSSAAGILQCPFRSFHSAVLLLLFIL